MQVLHTKTTHKPVAALKQIFIRIPMNGKLSISLFHLCCSILMVFSLGELLKQIKQSKSKRIIVFCNNVDSCRAVDHLLNENSVPTACLHGEILPKVNKRVTSYFSSRLPSCLRDGKRNGKSFLISPLHLAYLSVPILLQEESILPL